MDKTSLGDRMKRYEAAYNQVLPIRIPLMLRLDGVHFSKNVKRWKSVKPFDTRLTSAMQMTCKGLAKAIPGTQLVYSQSDEITILVRDDMGNDTQPWFGKELNKILSDSASKASNLFNFHFFKDVGFPLSVDDMAEFDCRAYVLPEYEIINAFTWRQRDCTKNSVSMLARTMFSTKQLHGKNGSEMQDMMMLQHRVNWNDMPTAFKRGFCVVKQDVPKMVPVRDDSRKVIEGQTQTIMRPDWVVDKEIPIFTQNPDYINRFTRISQWNKE